MKSIKNIHINCDMGESYGNFKIGNDDAIFPYITACNIACGFHGGDPLHIEQTIKKAIQYNLNIGAHPSYPDLAGFGRRKMEIKSEELKAIVKYQIAALKGLCESSGGQLSYVKPHGSLYNVCSNSERETIAVIEAIQEMDDSLAFMGLAGSIMEEVAKIKEVQFIAEAFIDRRYTSYGKLQSRNKKNAVITEPKVALEQLVNLVQHQRVESVDGQWISLNAQSFCIHGDNPSAVSILQLIQDHFGKLYGR